MNDPLFTKINGNEREEGRLRARDEERAQVQRIVDKAGYGKYVETIEICPFAPHDAIEGKRTILVFAICPEMVTMSQSEWWRHVREHRAVVASWDNTAATNSHPLEARSLGVPEDQSSVVMVRKGLVERRFIGDEQVEDAFAKYGPSSMRGA